MLLFGSLVEVAGVAIVVVGLLGVLLWVTNSTYVKTYFQVARAGLGESARSTQAANAVNLMKQGIEECTQQVHKAKSGLVKVQGSIAGLERQVKDGATEEARLASRVQKGIDDGKANGDTVLTQLATGLKRVREDLKANREQLEAQHSIYNDLLAQIGNAQRRATQLEGEASSLGAQLETSKLTAELADFATTFDAKGVQGSLDGVGKYRDMIRKQIDDNNAKLIVNRDLGATGHETKVWEEEQDANELLNEFRKPKA